MLEFFGGKPAVGPQACFEIIEPTKSRRKPRGFEERTTHIFEDVQNIPGPEHFIGEKWNRIGRRANDSSSPFIDYGRNKGNSNEGIGETADETTVAVVHEDRRTKTRRFAQDRLGQDIQGPYDTSEDAIGDWSTSERVDVVSVLDHSDASPNGFAATEAVPNATLSATPTADLATDGMPAAGAAPLFIRGALVINDDAIFDADVLVEDKIIKQVSPKIEVPEGAVVIDGTGKFLMPAGIDCHIEFSAHDSLDDFVSGSKAALAGGTTTVIESIIPNDGESLLAAYERVYSKAISKSLCNFGFSVAVNSWNDSMRKEMETIANTKGVNSFILMLSKDDELYEALEYCKELGVHARVYPENRNIIALLEKKMLAIGMDGASGYLKSRPETLEAEMVNRLRVLSQLTNCPISVMSVSSSEAKNALLQAAIGCQLLSEVSAAAIAFDGVYCSEKGIKPGNVPLTYIPIRVDPPAASQLIECLSSTKLCSVVSSHRAVNQKLENDFTKVEKGIGAVEERMAIVWERCVNAGFIDPMRFVAITSSNIAKILNLYPKKGRIAAGADADLVLWDPNRKQKFSSKNNRPAAGFCAFESLVVTGCPVLTICGGSIAYQDTKFGSQRGCFVECASFSPYLFYTVHLREKGKFLGKVENTPTITPPKQLPETNKDSFDSRPINPKSHRNQFESNFSVTGAQADDAKGIRASTKILHPPGGRSSGFW